MKTWITAKRVDEQVRELKNLHEPAECVQCLYLPHEHRAARLELSQSVPAAEPVPAGRRIRQRNAA